MTEDQKVAVAVIVGLLNDHFEDIQIVYSKGALKEIIIDAEDEAEDGSIWDM